jgi:carboxymethylenebutenolidase
MPAYLARPAGPGPVPAVIVLQEIFGVNREIRRVADLLANGGYAALAINFYYRTDPDLDVGYDDAGRERGIAAAAQVQKAELRADIEAAVRWLGQQPYVRRDRIATWGFCFGGTAAFLSATVPGVHAAVSFYGAQIAKPMRSGEPGALAEVEQVQAPLFLAFGAEDASIPSEDVRRIEAELRRAGKDAEVRIYPGVGHGFFRESSAALDSPAVADAWRRVQEFLARHLA